MKTAIIAIAAVLAGCNIECPDAPAEPVDLGWATIDTGAVHTPGSVDTVACRTFDNPFGEDAHLDAIVVKQTRSIAGVSVYAREGADGPSDVCPTDLGELLYDRAEQSSLVVDLQLPATSGIVVVVHVINLSELEARSVASVDLHGVAP